MSFYADRIRATLLEQTDGLEPAVDVRHVEAWMRLTRSTLDQLSPEQWEEEVRTAAACAWYAGADRNETLARSYCL
jgi:hypothetical protein